MGRALASSKNRTMWRREYRWACDRGLEYCRECLEFRTDLQFGHILAQALGGGNERTNTTLLCPECNNSNGTQYIQYPYLNFKEEYWRMIHQLKFGDVTFKGIVMNIKVFDRRPDYMCVTFDDREAVYPIQAKVAVDAR